MAYFGLLLSNELLLHAIRSAKPALTDGQGRPVTAVTLRRKANGALRSGGDYLRHKRRELFKEQKGLCHWCREPMTLIERTDKKQGEPKIKRRPDEATIEHLDPRYSPERGKHAGEIRQVLACSSCNNVRANEDVKRLPIQTRWEWSGQLYHLAMLTGALNEVTNDQEGSRTQD